MKTMNAMRNRKVEVQVPCDVNYFSMQKTKIGRYCERCSMSIIDFTNYTDDEILKYLEDYKGERVCGKAIRRPHQNRKKRNGILSHLKPMTLAVFLLISSCVASKKKEIYEAPIVVESNSSGEPKLEDIELKRENVIYGVVKYNMGNPAIGAMVQIEGTEIKTISGLDGRFEIDKPEGDLDSLKLKVMDIGVPDFEVFLNEIENDIVVIQLEPEGEVMLGTFVRIPWYKRIWYGIKGLFRNS